MSNENLLNNEILGGLEELGLSKYEASAYLGLLGKGMVSATELAFCSDLPRTKIYFILKKLEKKNLVFIKNQKPLMLFIDEIDSLLGTRNGEVGGEVRVKNQFLTEMDGINGKSKDSFLYVIGATNKPWSLESGFLRRFQKRIYVTLPDIASRKNLLNNILQS